MTCQACNSTNNQEKYPSNNENWAFDGANYAFQVCNDCGFMWASPIPTMAVLDEFYKFHYDYNMFKWQAPFKKIQAKHRLFKMRNHLKPNNKFLDFGCGHGYLVESASEKQIKSYGFDVGADKIIQKQTHSLTYGVNIDTYKEKDFDLISLWHVLEHMADPIFTLKQLNSKLKVGGKIFIAVPNSESLGFKLGGEKWGWCQQPYVHIHHYNHKNLSLLLEKSGFKIVSFTTSDTWDGSLYDVLMQQLFFKTKPRGTLKIDYTKKINLLLIVDSILRLCFAPLSYLYSFIRKDKNEGSELRIVGEKA